MGKTGEYMEERLERLVSRGVTEAKFGKIGNAKIFSNLLANRGIASRIKEMLGHATTVDTNPGIILKKHFLVSGETTTAHKVLGKFV